MCTALVSCRGVRIRMSSSRRATQRPRYVPSTIPKTTSTPSAFNISAITYPPVTVRSAMPLTAPSSQLPHILSERRSRTAAPRPSSPHILTIYHAHASAAEHVGRRRPISPRRRHRPALPPPGCDRPCLLYTSPSPRDGL